MHFSLLSIIAFASVALGASNPCTAPSGTQVVKQGTFEEGKSDFVPSNEGGGIFATSVVVPGDKSGFALQNVLNSDGFISVGLLQQNISTCDGAQYTYSIDYKYNQFNGVGNTTISAFIKYGKTQNAVVLPHSTNVGTAGTKGLGVYSSQQKVFTAKNHLGAGELRIQLICMQKTNITLLLDNISIVKM